jgi:hypothetical protein
MPAIVRKIVVAVLVLAGLAWLFVKTLRDTNSEPYVVKRDELSTWVLVAQDGLEGPALLALEPTAQMVGDVFRQIFTRTGQSLASPVRPSMPVVLASEYAGSLKGILSRDELIETARSAGVESEPIEPVCLGVKKDPQSARSSQRFFLVFESRGFSRLREELARLHATRSGSGTFEPGALRPVLPVASADADFDRWPWPVAVDTDVDCVAPVAVR